MKNILYYLTFLIIWLTAFTASKSQLLFQLGNQGDTYGRAVTIDKDSNFIVAGTFQGALNFNPKGTNIISSNVGSIDIFVAKYDKRGNYLWVKNIGTTGIDMPTAVEVDFSGNVFLTGYFGSENVPGRFIDLDPSSKEANFYGEGGIDCFLIKLNSFGDYQWGFVLTNKDNFGSEIIWDMAINKAGQIYLSGIFSATVDFNPKGNRKRITCPTLNHGYFTAKYDRSGENLWVSVIGANITNPLNEGFASIDIDGNDGCIIGGNFRDSAKFEPDIDTPFPMVCAGNSDMFLARYSSLGKITMRGGFGGNDADRIFPRCTKIGTDGNIYITGNFLGKADFYPGVGTIEIENKGSEPQIFLASYTLSGSMRWAYSLDSDAGEDAAYALDFDGDGNVCLSGYFTGTTNFEPKGEKFLTSNASLGAADAFFAKYDNSGNLIWANNFGDNISGTDKYNRPQLTNINAFKIDPEDNAIVTGKFYGTVDFDPASERTIFTANNIFDLFVVKYDYDGFLWFEGGTRPKLRLISPNGGEVWNVDSTRVISWSSKSIDYIRIDYSIDDGNTWMLISDSVSASSSSYSWIVENTPSEDCKVKITNLTDKNLFDISNGTFEITSDVKPSRVIFSWGNPGPVSGKSVAVDSKNNIVVAGAFQGTINCDQGNGIANLTAKGNQDMVLAKYNTFGDLIWAYNIGTLGITCEPNVIALDGSDNIYVAGYFGKSGETGALLDFSAEAKVDTLKSLGGYDAFIAKYTKDGKFLWANTFGNSSGISKEVINDLSVENNGTIYVTGVFYGTVDFNPSKSVNTLQTKEDEPELFIAKYGTDGKYGWAINIATKMTEPETEGMASIQPDGSGGCFVSGNFRDSINFHPQSTSGYWMKSKAENDIFLARYKVNGYLDWAIQIEGTGNDLTHSNCLSVGAGGNLYLAGIFNGKADFFPGLPKYEITSMGGNEDIFIASYSTGGNYNWAKQLPSNNGIDFPKALAIDTSGNILLTGYFSESINFDVEQSSVTFTSNGKNGATDIFLAKFTQTGNAIWATHFGADTSGTDNNSRANSMAIDYDNNSIITGDFFGENVDFDGAETAFFMSSQGRNDAFIAKYIEDGNLWIQAPDTSQLFLTAPNGGEKIHANSIYNITWQSKYIDYVTLKYSIDGGINWITINESVPAGVGIYSWIVPNISSDNCKILIYNPGNTRKMDISNGSFIITDKYLDLISPNGGEQLIANTVQEIKWSSNKVNHINIYFSSDAGTTWKPIASYYNSTLSSMTWSGLEINSNQCLIKIIDITDDEVFDISDKTFSMKKSTLNDIKVFSPNGGEQWHINTHYNIAWTSFAVDTLKIELSTNAGTSWITINEQILATSFIYNWLIESNAYISDSCLIRISDKNDNSVYDISDSLFTIDIEDNVKEKNNFHYLEIYPQPAEDKIILNFSLFNNSEFEFEIFNSLLELVYKSQKDFLTAGEHSIIIDSSKLISGNYFLKILSSGQKSYVKFIILK
ncbi:MAG: T9SS type A sorting domain-containing protein [bacterium]